MLLHARRVSNIYANETTKQSTSNSRTHPNHVVELNYNYRYLCTLYPSQVEDVKYLYPHHGHVYDTAYDLDRYDRSSTPPTDAKPKNRRPRTHLDIFRVRTQMTFKNCLRPTCNGRLSYCDVHRGFQCQPMSSNGKQPIVNGCRVSPSPYTILPSEDTSSKTDRLLTRTMC